MIPCIIEPRHIDWPDPDARFGGHGPVRQVPITEAAAPAPEPYKPTIPTFYPPRPFAPRKHRQFPACTHEEGHRMVSNGAPDGKYRMKCTRCHRSRLATAEEAAELRANAGRKGRWRK
jgi:hypothetical protein